MPGPGRSGDRAGAERVRPRRSRCSGCRATHVLLPVFCLLRRAYSVAVIGAALAAKAALGLGHRRIAAGLGVPAGDGAGLVAAVRRAGRRRCGCSSPGWPSRPGWTWSPPGPAGPGDRGRGGRGRGVAGRGAAAVRRVGSARRGDGMGGGVRGQRWPVAVPGVAAGGGGAGAQHELSLTPPGAGAVILGPVAREQVPGRRVMGVTGWVTAVPMSRTGPGWRRRRRSGLFRFQLISPAIDDQLSTRARGRLVRQSRRAGTPTRSGTGSATPGTPWTGGSGRGGRAGSRRWCPHRGRPRCAPTRTSWRSRRR